jgi:ketosteroid isomerase-like protein
MLTEEFVREHFTCLANGDWPGFLKRLSDPLQTSYLQDESEDVENPQRAGPNLASSESELTKIEIRSILMSGDWAVVELDGIGIRNGKEFKESFCALARYKEGKMVKARGYFNNWDDEKVEKKSEDLKVGMPTDFVDLNYQMSLWIHYGGRNKETK